ncbi:MAG: response regulator [Chloroflexi bacterium]|nr:MAG: response regulator [Chloroflexota bacterium]
MRILYVEDNPANLFLVKRVARMGNHEVMNYIDGADVLANFGQDNPDLVLMDIQLVGDLTGLDVVRELRKQGFKTPIVAVTAYAMAGDRERCLEAGCDEYMAKPLSVPVLIELLGRYESALKSGNIASAIPESGVHEETSSTLSTATEAPATSTQDSAATTSASTEEKAETKTEEKPATETTSATTSETTAPSTTTETATTSTQDSSSTTSDASASTNESTTAGTASEAKPAETASTAESTNSKAESTDATASEVSTTSNGNSAVSTSNSTNGNPSSN